MQFDTIYERTEAGFGEVRAKTNRLTQSERLVLIMLDGRTDVATLIEKLPSLSMPRVFRAMVKLQEMGLMNRQAFEPVGIGGGNDSLSADVVDRFLQQTDLDPATVVRSTTDDFPPTLLLAPVSVDAATAPRRGDTDLERRLTALMGETPKFAREEAPRKPRAVVEVAPEEVVDAAKKPMPPVVVPVAAQSQGMSKSGPVSVARTGGPVTKSRVSAEANGRATKPRPVNDSSSRPMAPRSSASAAGRSTGSGSQTDSIRTERSPRPSGSQRAPTDAGSMQPWMVYLLMASGIGLVAFIVVRVFLK